MFVQGPRGKANSGHLVQSIRRRYFDQEAFPVTSQIISCQSPCTLSEGGLKVAQVLSSEPLGGELGAKRRERGGKEILDNFVNIVGQGRGVLGLLLV